MNDSSPLDKIPNNAASDEASQLSVGVPSFAEGMIEPPAPFTLEPRVFATTVKGRRRTATFICAITPEGDILAQRETGEQHSGDIYNLVADAAERELAARDAVAEAANEIAQDEGQLFDESEFIKEAPKKPRKSSSARGKSAVGDTVQIALEGMENPVKKKRDTVSFGRFARPEQYDVFGEHNFDTLTPKEKTWNPHEALGKILFEPPKPIYPVKTPEDQAFNDRLLVVDGYSFNAFEHNLLVRYPNALSRKSVAQVLGDEDITDTKMAASSRVVGHVMKKLAPPMIEHAGKLQVARDEIRDLLRDIKAPGYAHHTPEWMTQHLGTLWKELQIMLDIAHVRKGWDDEQRQAASTALLYYLTQGSQNERTSHFRNMAELADGYLGARIHVFDNRIQIATSRIPASEKDSIAS